MSPIGLIRTGGALAARRVPEAYVRAEVAAFPLTNVSAFVSAITQLDPILEKPLREQLTSRRDTPESRATTRLWHLCERELVQHASGWSLDRMVSVRDRFWFGSPCENSRSPVPMHRYLERLARAHLELRPGATRPRTEATESGAVDASNHYRWLTFAIPEDLIMAALPIDPPPTKVAEQHVLLTRRLLDRGVAELHLHAGAGLDFPLLWVGAMAALSAPELARYAIREGDGFEWKSGVEGAGGRARTESGAVFLQWLLVAAISRIVLAQFLLDAVRPRGPHTLEEALTPGGCHVLRCIESDGARGFGIRGILASMAWRSDDRPPAFDRVHRIYRRMYELLTFRGGVYLRPAFPLRVDDVWQRRDPVAILAQLTTENGGERWLIRRSLDYLKSTDGRKPDEWFARLFWQYVRVRCFYYRHVVQRPLTAGLQWFIRFYGRIGELSQLSEVRPEAAYRNAGAGERLASMEIRTSADDQASEFAETLVGTLTSWQYAATEYGQGTQPEFGVVVHFTKERDSDTRWLSGTPLPFGRSTYGEPRQPPFSDTRSTKGDGHPGSGRSPLTCQPVPGERRQADTSSESLQGRAGLPPEGRNSMPADSSLPTDTRGLRYDEYLRSQVPKASAVADLLRLVPIALWLVRGVDVAKDELGIPNWVVAPLYHYVKQEAARASASPKALGAPTIRTTAHCGEDFHHLMGGLRQLFESINYLLDDSGSRVGHATAMGIEPRAWAEAIGAVLMPLEDRLWDLVCEWRLYTGFQTPTEFRASAPSGRLDYLRNEIQHLAEQMFGSGQSAGFDPRHLAQVHDSLHKFMLPEPGTWMCAGDIAVDRALRRFWAREGCKSPVAQRLRQYLQDPAVFRRGQALVDVTIDNDEVEALAAVQGALRTGVCARGIVVEVNPTSNLLIADMLDMKNHPILRIFPVEHIDGVLPVPIVVGSDDPVTFNTNLLKEYDYLYQTARTVGYPERSVIEWLERIRQTSMDARFTLCWKPDAQQMAKRVLHELDHYLRTPTCYTRCRQREINRRRDRPE